MCLDSWGGAGDIELLTSPIKILCPSWYNALPFEPRHWLRGDCGGNPKLEAPSHQRTLVLENCAGVGGAICDSSKALEYQASLWLHVFRCTQQRESVAVYYHRELVTRCDLIRALKTKMITEPSYDFVMILFLGSICEAPK